MAKTFEELFEEIDHVEPEEYITKTNRFGSVKIPNPEHPNYKDIIAKEKADRTIGGGYTKEQLERLMLNKMGQVDYGRFGAKNSGKTGDTVTFKVPDRLLDEKELRRKADDYSRAIKNLRKKF